MEKGKGEKGRKMSLVLTRCSLVTHSLYLCLFSPCLIVSLIASSFERTATSSLDILILLVGFNFQLLRLKISPASNTDQAPRLLFLLRFVFVSLLLPNKMSEAFLELMALRDKEQREIAINRFIAWLANNHIVVPDLTIGQGED